MPNIEELLRKAMQEGKFDNLPGKGKPLNLEQTNPHADPSWELAFRMLKEAGYSLPWIETMRVIEADLAAACQDLRLAWQAYQNSCAQHGTTRSLTENWARSQEAFQAKIEQLNKRIRDYNLAVPYPRFQRPLLNFETELKRITSA